MSGYQQEQMKKKMEVHFNASEKDLQDSDENEKNHENTIISTTGKETHTRQKEGKMLARLCSDSENGSRMKNASKI